MKIKRESLLRELKFAAHAAERSSTVPILTHVLWSAEGKRLTLRATDTHITLESELELDAPAESAVELAVPAAPSISLLNEMTDDELTLAIEGLLWSAHDDRSDVKLDGLDPQDFPTQPSLEGVESVNIPAGRLRAAIAATRHAGIAVGALNNAPTGFALALEEPLTLAATDGNRLAISGSLDALKSNGQSLVRLPPDAVKILDGLDGKDKDEWELRRDAHRVLVRAGGQSLSFRQVEGAFPAVATVIGRSKGQHSFAVDRRELLAAARAAGACPGLEGAEGGTVAVKIGEGEGLELHAIGKFSEVRRRVAAKVEGPAYTLGTNPSFLIDMLESITGNEVQIHYEAQPMHALHYESLGDPVSEWRVAMPKTLPGGVTK